MLNNTGVTTANRASPVTRFCVSASRHADQDSGSRIMTWIIAKTLGSIDLASIEASTAGSPDNWELTRPTSAVLREGNASPRKWRPRC